MLSKVLFATKNYVHLAIVRGKTHVCAIFVKRYHDGIITGCDFQNYDLTASAFMYFARYMISTPLELLIKRADSVSEEFVNEDDFELF